MLTKFSDKPLKVTVVKKASSRKNQSALGIVKLPSTHMAADVSKKVQVNLNTQEDSCDKDF
jgi:hypothetical protein